MILGGMAAGVDPVKQKEKDRAVCTDIAAGIR